MTLSTTDLRNYHATHAALERAVAGATPTDRALDDLNADRQQVRKARLIVDEAVRLGVKLEAIQFVLDCRRPR